jgi:hypothetical protein
MDTRFEVAAGAGTMMSGSAAAVRFRPRKRKRQSALAAQLAGRPACGVARGWLRCRMVAGCSRPAISDPGD